MLVELLFTVLGGLIVLSVELVLVRRYEGRPSEAGDDAGAGPSQTVTGATGRELNQTMYVNSGNVTGDTHHRHYSGGRSTSEKSDSSDEVAKFLGVLLGRFIAVSIAVIRTASVHRWVIAVALGPLIAAVMMGIYLVVSRRPWHLKTQGALLAIVGGSE